MTINRGTSPSSTTDLTQVNSRLDALEALTGTRYVVLHSASATRPSVPAGNVLYLSPAQPTTWLDGDQWIVTSS